MMQTRLRLLIWLALPAFLFTACSRVPRQARYIPKDAFAVAGLHTGKMRNELAWSAIMGSGLLDEWRKAAESDQLPAAAKDLENSGIDFSSTLYGFTKPDARFPDKMKMAAVLPLSDAEKLGAYVAKYFPGAAVRKEGDVRMACLNAQLCIGWNDEVAILMKEMVRRVPHTEPAGMDTVGGMTLERPPHSWDEEIADTAGSFAELVASLKPAKGTGIDEDDRFAKLEKAGHDLTLWVSYDALVDMYYADREEAGSMLSASVAEMLMKGSAMASGFDFKKGRIEGLMRYYSSDSLRPVAREFGKENVDADMLRRLPAADLYLAGGMHLSPAALKLLLEKLNLSGVANLALMSQGLSLDDVLGGFTGDMVFAINNFRMDPVAPDSAWPATMPGVISPKMDFVFAMKIGDKARLEKLLRVAGQALVQVSPKMYQLPGGQNTLVIGDKYMAASSNAGSAQAFLREHAGAMPDAVHREISGHPLGLWADLHGFFKASSAANDLELPSAEALTVLQKTFDSFGINGGEMKDGANEYRLSLRFADKEENSLLQLLRMAQQLSALGGAKPQASAMK